LRVTVRIEGKGFEDNGVEDDGLWMGSRGFRRNRWIERVYEKGN
jgi:hypothetical protein